MPTYDAIVLGLGGMGSATLFHLARRGLRVLGLERFDGEPVVGSEVGALLIELGFRQGPRRLTLSA